jgi:two-component system sensor histidine kinase YesM
MLLQSERTSYLVGYYPSLTTGWQVVGVVPFQELASGIQQTRFIVAAAVIVSLVVVLILSTFISKSITKPLKELGKSMKWVENGIFTFRVEVNREDEIGRLSQSFNHMLTELDHLTETVYVAKNKEMQLQLMNREAELKALQNQINPHFLYNTLNTMSCIGEIRKVYEVSEMSKALASMFKYSISNEAMSTVGEEVEHVRSFISIMELRYPFSFRLLIDIEIDMLEEEVVKLVLQPLVENAVFHGIEPRQTDGCIRISCREVGETIVLQVSDDGIGMTMERQSEIMRSITALDSYNAYKEHVALRNIAQRMRLHYRDQAKMEILSEVGQGTTVTLQWSRGGESIV